MSRWMDLDLSGYSNHRVFRWGGPADAAIGALRGAVNTVLERWRPAHLRVEAGHFDHFDQPVIERYLKLDAAAVLPADTVEVARDLPIAIRLAIPTRADLRAPWSIENPEHHGVDVVLATAPPIAGVESRWIVLDDTLPHWFLARRPAAGEVEIEWTPGPFVYDREEGLIRGQPVATWREADEAIDRWIVEQLTDLGFVEVQP
jgi:hypothetical protein